jgi:hypothetical protein
MTPEERRRLRKEKIMKRQNLTEQEIASSLINNNIEEIIKKSEQFEIKESEKTSPKELKSNFFHKKEKSQNLKKIKFVLFIILGILTSVFTFLYKVEQHPNIFLLFLIVDISLNYFLFNDRIETDRDIYSQKVQGFITLVEKMSLFFEFIDDLACYFIPFIITTCFIHFAKLN